MAENYTVFKLGDEELACKTSLIKSSLAYDSKQKKVLPKVDKFILGKDSQNRVLVDLNLYLKFPLKQLSHILYSDYDNQELGFVVNANVGPLDIADEQISPTPDSILQKYQTHFITGIAQIDNRLIILIDPSQIFTQGDEEKINQARTIEPKKGFLGGLFGKKNQSSPQPTSNQTQEIKAEEKPQSSVDSKDIQTNDLTGKDSLDNKSEPVTQLSNIPHYAEIIEPEEPKAPLVTEIQELEKTNAVLDDLKDHISQIQVEDAIIDDEEFKNRAEKDTAGQIESLKQEVDTPQEEINEAMGDFKKFFDKLKENPFIKRQEKINTDLKKLKNSMNELDHFFEDLLVKEETNKSSYDASEEVLLSSIGIELNEPFSTKEDKKLESKLNDSGENTKEDTSEFDSEEISKLQDEFQNLQEELNKSISDDQAFKFNDGRLIHSVSQFIEELKIISDDEFSSHVNQDKNDFAEWVEHAIELKDVADFIRPILEKQQMIDNLEKHFEKPELLVKYEEEKNKVDSVEETTSQDNTATEDDDKSELSKDEKNKLNEELNKSINDDQAFKFNDGRLIHSVSQFIEELKIIPDDEFSSHVNQDKNDFAEWVEHAIELKDVADFIRPILEKQQMITGLEERYQVVSN